MIKRRYTTTFCRAAFVPPDRPLRGAYAVAKANTDTHTLATEPWQLTAVEAAAAIRSRALSSAELVQSCLDRIEATNRS